MGRADCDFAIRIDRRQRGALMFGNLNAAAAIIGAAVDEELKGEHRSLFVAVWIRAS